MRFLLRPGKGSYSVDFPKESHRVELDGGPGRYRRDILNGSFMVDCQWVLTPTQYDYAMAFYRTQTQRGSLPFEIYLIVDDSVLGERTAYFVPGTLKLVSQEGFAQTISATLEVLHLFNPDEASDDAAIISAYNTSQGYTP